MSFQFRNDYCAHLCVYLYATRVDWSTGILICGAELATEGCLIQGQLLIIDMYEDRWNTLSHIWKLTLNGHSHHTCTRGEENHNDRSQYSSVPSSGPIPFKTHCSTHASLVLPPSDKVLKTSFRQGKGVTISPKTTNYKQYERKNYFSNSPFFPLRRKIGVLEQNMNT